ncbi:MAG TPA: hypothetical protein VJS92_15040, partial [Candidatus Polarisedimenticolaceae bacterium]|nr:hypothetical protein [Candidatus Polarisedimenticolaceae bacterium]
PAEAAAAVARVFGPNVRLETGPRAVLLVGDFNGDRTPDLAVSVLPASTAALAALNHPLANWIVENAVERVHARAVAPPPRIEAQDRLLAVIHGYGATGWRNPAARQAYLVRDALGDAPSVAPTASVLRAPPGVETIGHVIRETRDGRAGYLFWSGARYVWREI